MTIYKTVMKIVRTNRGNLIIGIVITLVITFFYAQSTTSINSSLEGTNIAIISEDDAAISQELTSYLGKQQTIVSLDDTSQKGIDDALYFNQVSYILFIPADFSEKLFAGELPQLDIQARPDAFSKSLVTQQINHFLNTFLRYHSLLQDETQALAATKETLAVSGEVIVDKGFSERANQAVKGMMFNVLAYGLFMSIFSGYAVVNLAFNQEQIKKRNRYSPVSKRKINRSISFSLFGYSSFLTLLFLLFLIVYTQSGWTSATGYFVLNVLMFFLPILTFSSCATTLVTNSEAISGISNVFILGSCFLGGVFMPAEFLPEIVTKIAAFTPTYWFVQNNTLIGSTMNFDASFQQEFGFNCLILLAFAAAFLVVQLILGKERGWLVNQRNAS